MVRYSCINSSTPTAKQRPYYARSPLKFLKLPAKNRSEYVILPSYFSNAFGGEAIMQQAALSPTYKPIPMAAGEPFLGNYREIQQKEILKFVEDLRLRYGDLVQFKVGPFPLIFVCHPDHLYHIFVKNSANYIKGAR